MTEEVGFLTRRFISFGSGVRLEIVHLYSLFVCAEASRGMVETRIFFVRNTVDRRNGLRDVRGSGAET